MNEYDMLALFLSIVVPGIFLVLKGLLMVGAIRLMSRLYQALHIWIENNDHAPE